MIVRLGYVALPLDIDDCSPSRTITYTNYTKIPNEDIRQDKILSLTKANLENTIRILKHNITKDISIYRITSKLVPLVTHDNVTRWNYIGKFKHYYDQIANIIESNNLRISSHPDIFNVLNSPNENVIYSSLDTLIYQNIILDAFRVTPVNGKLVMHIGGSYGNKNKSIKRFITNFARIPDRIKSRIIVENDDKIYNIKDTLYVAKSLGIPMVLDVHHHWCNNDGLRLSDFLFDIFSTWNNEVLSPKIHVSSPKSDKEFRSHADYINFESFNNFIKIAKTTDMDFDVMIEAKKKNLALYKLMEDIKKSTNYTIKNGASFIV
ncbi:UV DNA damage repair endonuclease UvsE [Clostridiaceae bacterium M8S5]|nr:UV DNA damage repair endonuclease UvsE [Clostridiaceae bacterium M8S5]